MGERLDVFRGVAPRLVLAGAPGAWAQSKKNVRREITRTSTGSKGVKERPGEPGVHGFA